MYLDCDKIFTMNFLMNLIFFKPYLIIVVCFVAIEPLLHTRITIVSPPTWRIPIRGRQFDIDGGLVFKSEFVFFPFVTNQIIWFSRFSQSFDFFSHFVYVNMGQIMNDFFFSLAIKNI